MKTILACLSLLSSLLLTSCATQSVYLQNLNVEGPHVRPPLFITKDKTEGEVRFAPRLSLNDKTPLVGRATGHSNVNTSGVYQVDTVNDNGIIRYFERTNANTKTFEGRNFAWEPTRVTASLDIEYAVTKRTSLVVGADYSSGSSQSFLGANAGVAFSFESNSTALRVDLGAHWSSVTYDVNYIVATKGFGSSQTEVQFFHEKGKDSHWNAYGALTFNTKAVSWPVQLFTQLAINRQTVVNLDRHPTTVAADKSVVLESVSFFLITPGLYFDLSPTSRLLVGLQLRDETELLEAQPGVLISPFVQFEFGL